MAKNVSQLEMNLSINKIDCASLRPRREEPNKNMWVVERSEIKESAFTHSLNHKHEEKSLVHMKFLRVLTTIYFWLYTRRKKVYDLFQLYFLFFIAGGILWSRRENRKAIVMTGKLVSLPFCVRKYYCCCSY